MAKKFKYNHETLDFDEAKHTILDKLRKAILWIFSGALFAVVYYIFFSQFFSTPQERKLKQVNSIFTENYAYIESHYEQLQKVVQHLGERDANIYSAIFESAPSHFIKNDTNMMTSIEEVSSINLLYQTKNRIDVIGKSIKQQTQFLSKVIQQNNHSKALLYIPSIQPVSNHNFHHTAATYGMRMHPFYKVLKMHHGIDFTVPIGTNVYATAHGHIASITNDMRSKGLTVVIDHKNGYKTSYAHLNNVNVRVGQTVTRKQVIALSGNTGRSVAPHLHYEIERNGKTINPLHYFFQDISANEYNQLLTLASNKSQSLD
ncbi:MAG: M23 family metallopeptidase [Bacteroidales bacterium]